jgi:hypothetical protein
MVEEMTTRRRIRAMTSDFMASDFMASGCIVILPVFYPAFAGCSLCLKIIKLQFAIFGKASGARRSPPARIPAEIDRLKLTGLESPLWTGMFPRPVVGYDVSGSNWE